MDAEAGVTAKEQGESFGCWKTEMGRPRSVSAH